ncbi:ROK family protein [Garciella nitratireducens]|uniref:Glucokinase n=1 Tax=Garciella nitratireducens DSM 15102 TaxID=1121911 RepID=A0A1T4NW92_9FIRM|nr:ROK family glucokinase [Garciella nitratireducens]SJZ83493.1 glucokinase [Garciella nitratireducens DSM 15102]
MRIGVDLGGTNIKVGAVNDKGEIVFQNTRPTKAEKGVEGIVKDIIEQIEEILQRTNISREQLQSIGIGVPGLVEKSTGKIIHLTNLFLDNVDLGQKIQAYFHKPIFVDNDATVAGLAEKIAGSTQGVKNSIFITLGTGVGGGIIINDKVYNGGHGWGSEIGHIVVGENFYDCNCGRNGCLETFASATALIRYVKKRIEEGKKESFILEKVGGKIDQIEGKTIIDAAREGDILAKEAMDRLIQYLAIGIVNLLNVLDPEKVVIGGGLSKAGDFLLNPLKEEVQKRLSFKEVTYGDIVLARLGNDAGIIGAAFLGENV